MEDLKFDVIPLFQLIILLFVFLGIIFIIFLLPKFSRQKIINKNEHGSAKFADIKEIKNTFVKEKIENTNSVGFPVWYEKNNKKFKYVYFDENSAHFLITGATGSGKSVGVVIPECIFFATSKEKHSVVITDPKGEIFEKTGSIFNENGYEVITLDFRNPTFSKRINLMQPIINEWKLHCEYNKIMYFLLDYYLKTHKINIKNKTDEDNFEETLDTLNITNKYLKDIIKTNIDEISNNENNNELVDNKLLNELLDNNSNNVKIVVRQTTEKELEDLIIKAQNISLKHQAETNRFVISLSNLIFTEKDSNDKFWINSAKNLFIGIVGIFLEDYKSGLIDADKINISSIKKFQNSSLVKINQAYLQQNLNNRKYGSLSKDYLTSILSAAENTYKSITTVFAEKMAIFDDLNVEHITSSNDFDFIDLGIKPIALFIIVPDEEKSYYQLVTLIVGMLTKDLTRFANLPENGGILPRKIEWILDEFANCPALDSIETLVSVARSRGMRFQFFIQSFSQLDQVYGKDISNIIQDNCALVYLKTNSVETAEVISRKLGKKTIETNSISQSTNPMKIGANETKSLMGKELLSVTEIMSLKHKIIIFSTISNPIFSNTYLYNDIFPKYKDIKKLERSMCALKRNANNYYTVDDMKKLYSNQQMNNSTQTISHSITTKKHNNIATNSNNNLKMPLSLKLRKINELFKNRSVINLQQTEHIFKFKINGLLNNFEISKLKKLLDDEFILIIAKNKYSKSTIVYIENK